eukprot:m.10181 g.10181  ORF g.10181 m.10181 type:complete len:187 (-) comp6537_c0_seq2:47-607(-)
MHTQWHCILQVQLPLCDVYVDIELWNSNPEMYQYATKVEPTWRALKQLNVDVWITGRRRSQGGQRDRLEILERTDSGTIKVNPLAYWDWGEVWEYIHKCEVPYNHLLDKGYKSVGDVHSTAKVDANASEREGRWKGKKQSECGMHTFSFSEAAQSPLSDHPHTSNCDNKREEEHKAVSEARASEEL